MVCFLDDDEIEEWLTMWRLWAKALGEKATSCDKESDKVAFIRTVLVLQAFVTNFVIIANFYMTHFMKSCQ